MNAVIELIQSHRSIRKFTEQAISDDLLREILQSGQSAATSSFIQATTIINLTDKNKRATVALLAGGQPYIESAAVFLIVCADLKRNKNTVQKEHTGEYEFDWTEQFVAATVDTALFAQNITLAAESADLGCCYIGGIRNDIEAVAQLLELPELVYPVFGLCIGYPAQNPDKKPRLPIDTVVMENRYDCASEEYNKLMDEYDVELRGYYDKRTRGKIKLGWSEQMFKQTDHKKRKFMLNFLQKKGFLKR